MKAEKIAQEQALAEKQRLEAEKIAADELASKARIAEEQRIAKIEADRVATEQQKGLQALEDARLEANRIAQENNTVTSTTTTPDDTSILSKIANKFNNAVTNTNLNDLGTTGLGGGNAPVVVPPQSVITSNNPNDIWDFYKGAGKSAGAGAITAATIITGAGGAPLLTQVLTPTVVKVLTAANLITDTIPIANCAATGNAEACQEAAFSISNPIPGGQYADDLTDALSTFKPLKIPTNFSAEDFTKIRGAEIRNNIIDFVNKNPDINTYAGSAENALNLDYDSIASRQTTELAQQLMDTYGYDTGRAITAASNSVLPPYDHSGQYIKQADEAFTIEQQLACPGGRCRHFEPISSKVANDMGYETLRYNSAISYEGSKSGHRFSVMTLSPTEKILLDSTNNLSGPFNVFEDLENIFSSQWKFEMLAPFQILNP